MVKTVKKSKITKAFCIHKDKNIDIESERPRFCK